MKKGVSPIIAWVLLVGMAVSIGTMVSIYLINQAKEFNPGAGQELELYCSDVAIDGQNLCYESIENNDVVVLKLKIKNKGKFNIYGINLGAESGDLYQYDFSSTEPLTGTTFIARDTDNLIVENFVLYPGNNYYNISFFIPFTGAPSIDADSKITTPHSLTEISLNPEIKIEGEKVVCNQKVFKLKTENINIPACSPT